MKKTIYITVVILLSLTLCILAAGCRDTRDNIHITISPSEKFSKAEIESAVDCVITQFNGEFTGCTLTDLWYDEERSDLWVRHYSKNNAIALLSNIKTGDSDVCGGFEPNDTYTDWCWILVRNSKDDEWEVKTSGY